ncbi:ABC transporter permease [Kitasatospora sp. NPDC056783]|uniref:ABC transporter permease n=1 Tax=Kitasatospora sp. NPDC056783 TaxID=3345943 RepID=UPI0036999225
MSGAYWAELRRSPLRWVFPVLVAVVLLALFGRSTSWIGVWSQASAAAQIPAFYLGPAMAGAAAWSAAAKRRAGVEVGFGAARPWWRIEAVRVAAVLTYGLVAYAVGVLAAVVVTARDGGPSFWWPGYVLLGAVLITACTALGHLAGRRARSLYAVPVVCTLGCLVFLGLIGFVPQGTSRGVGLAVLTGNPGLTVAAWPLLVRAAAALSLVWLAVIAGRQLRAEEYGPQWRRVRSFGTAGGVLALAGSLVLWALAGPLVVQRPAPAGPLCTDGTPKICVWPESRRFLPELREMAGRAAQLPGGRFRVAAQFTEEGVDGQPLDRGTGFVLREGETWEVATVMALRTAEETIPMKCRRAGAEQWELIAWLTARIAGHGVPASVHGGPPGVDQEAIGRLVDQPEDAQLAWVDQRLPRGGGCG